MAKDKAKKVKIPSSIKELNWGPKKFAKKNHIRIKGKGMTGKRRRAARKKLMKTYSIRVAENLNKAVRILSENPGDNKKMLKVRNAVDNVIHDSELMKRVAKLYLKNPKHYSNMLYLPYMISSTIMYYNDVEKLTDEQKEYAEKLDKTALLEFCEYILKKQIKHYRNAGFEDSVAFELANVIPTSKLLTGNRRWYRNLIDKLYLIAAISPVTIDNVLSAIRSVDKRKVIKKSDLLANFYSEVIMTRVSNKTLSYNDGQKEFHENLIESTLNYLDNLKEKELRELLKAYIKRRKAAEYNKKDGKRLVRFIDHANSNSSYTRIKTVVQDLISDNSSNELYLS